MTWITSMNKRRRGPPPSADDAWLSRWLAWLDRLEIAMGRSGFPEDPELEGLHAMWKAGATVQDAQRWIEEGARRG